MWHSLTIQMDNCLLPTWDHSPVILRNPQQKTIHATPPNHKFTNISQTGYRKKRIKILDFPTTTRYLYTIKRRNKIK